jgi:hypothetical protein
MIVTHTLQYFMKTTLVDLFLGFRKPIVVREILFGEVDKGAHLLVEIAPILLVVLLHKCQDQEKKSQIYDKFLAIGQPLRRTISKQTAKNTHPFRS